MSSILRGNLELIVLYGVKIKDSYLLEQMWIKVVYGNYIMKK